MEILTLTLVHKTVKATIFLEKLAAETLQHKQEETQIMVD